MRTRTLGLFLVLLLAGCGSSPTTHFYALEPVHPAQPSLAGPPLPRQGVPAAVVVVGAVHLPPSLDRLELVRQAPGNRLDVSEQDRWGAPLDEMTQHVLAADLAARLPAGTVLMPDAPKPKRRRSLVVDVATFDVDPAGEAVLDADWTVADAAYKPLMRRHAHLVIAGAGSFATQPRAMSQALAALAGQIAAALNDS